nr:MAG TPA: hypothetical protein [Caudoviricetes sp.]
MRIMSEEEEILFAESLKKHTKNEKERSEEMLQDLKRIIHEVDGICIYLATQPDRPLSEGVRLREKVLGSLEELEKAVEEHVESCRRTVSELGGDRR